MRDGQPRVAAELLGQLADDRQRIDDPLAEPLLRGLDRRGQQREQLADRTPGRLLAPQRVLEREVGPVPFRLGPPPEGRQADQARQGRRRQGRRQRRRDRVPSAPAGQVLGVGDRPGPHREAAVPAVEVLGHRRGRAVAAGRVLPEGLEADGLQVPRHARDQRPRRGRLAVADQVERLDRRGRLERRPAGQQGIEGRPEGVDVGRRADRPAAAGDLLGAHEAGGPPGADRPGGGGGGGGGGGRLGVELLHRDPEVGEQWRQVRPVGPGRPVEQDVRRLDVQVQQAGPVDRLDGTGHVADQPGGLAGRERPGDPVAEAAAGDQVEDQEEAPFVLAGLVEPDDVRVPDPADGAGLAEPAVAGPRVERRADRQHLDRHPTADRPLLRLVDDPAAAPAEPPADRITGDRRPARLVLVDGGRRRLLDVGAGEPFEPFPAVRAGLDVGLDRPVIVAVGVERLAPEPSEVPRRWAAEAHGVASAGAPPGLVAEHPPDPLLGREGRGVAEAQLLGRLADGRALDGDPPEGPPGPVVDPSADGLLDLGGPPEQGQRPAAPVLVLVLVRDGPVDRRGQGERLDRPLAPPERLGPPLPPEVDGPRPAERPEPRAEPPARVVAVAPEPVGQLDPDPLAELLQGLRVEPVGPAMAADRRVVAADELGPGPVIGPVAQAFQQGPVGRHPLLREHRGGPPMGRDRRALAVGASIPFVMVVRARSPARRS